MLQRWHVCLHCPSWGVGFFFFAERFRFDPKICCLLKLHSLIHGLIWLMISKDAFKRPSFQTYCSCVSCRCPCTAERYRLHLIRSTTDTQQHAVVQAYTLHTHPSRYGCKHSPTSHNSAYTHLHTRYVNHNRLHKVILTSCISVWAAKLNRNVEDLFSHELTEWKEMSCGVWDCKWLHYRKKWKYRIIQINK